MDLRWNGSQSEKKAPRKAGITSGIGAEGMENGFCQSGPTTGDGMNVGGMGRWVGALRSFGAEDAGCTGCLNEISRGATLNINTTTGLAVRTDDYIPT